MKIRRTKGKWYRHMIQGLLSVIDGLIRILSLGFFWSSLEYRYVVKNLGK